MPAIAFDTLKFVKRLRSAGFDEEKAEALSDALKEWYEAGLSDLATKQDIGMLKQDIKELEQSTKQDIKELEQSTKQDIKELELRLTGEIKLLKWTMGFLLAGVLSLLIKAFFT